jgi:K+-sensing histidine kinase KdpD
MDSYDILVIILSIALAIFLIVSIIAISLFIQILKKIRSISDTAQQTADNVVQFSENLKNAGKVTAVGSAVSQVLDIFKKGRK